MTSTVAPRVAQAGDEPPHVAAALGVQAGRRLVEDHQLGAAHQRAGEIDAAGLAAGQREHAHVGARLEREQREHLVDRARGGERRAPLAQRLADREVAGEAAALQQDAGAAPDRGAVGDRVQPEHADLTAGRGGQPFEHFERRGLAGAVGAEQGGDRAGRDVEVDAADRLVRRGSLPVGAAQSADPHRRIGVVGSWSCLQGHAARACRVVPGLTNPR